jgi:hypothetical protein
MMRGFGNGSIKNPNELAEAYLIFHVVKVGVLQNLAENHDVIVRRETDDG